MPLLWGESRSALLEWLVDWSGASRRFGLGLTLES